MKQLTAVLLCLVCYSFCDAQEHSYQLLLHAGTQGFGGAVHYQATERLGVRAGSSFIPLKLNNLGSVYDLSDLDYNTSVAAHFSNAHLWADFTPWGSCFRLVAGAGYFFKGEGEATITPKGQYHFGNILLTPDDMGTLKAHVSWKGIAPYLGIGLFRAVPKHRVNVNLDLGCYYLPAPDAQLTGTGLLSSNNEQSERLRQNLSGYRFLPVLQLNFNFKL